MQEQRRIVKQFDCGWIVPLLQEKQIALIDSIGGEMLDAQKGNARRAAACFDWETEASRLRDVYRGFVEKYDN